MDAQSVSGERQTGQGPRMPGLIYGFSFMVAAFEVIALHSLLAGTPAAAGIQGLVLFSLVVFGLTRLTPAGPARTQLLARTALLASALAVISALALSGKLAEAQGVDPASGPQAQTVLAMLFQMGWAFTYWLTAEKGLTEQSRFIPAALGVVVMIGGGVITRAPEAPVVVVEEGTEVFKKFATQEDFSFAVETERAGEESGTAFAHFHSGPQPLVGISFSTREWFRRERVDGDIRGIFEEGSGTEDGAYRFVAKPGYVVSALEVQADDYINAIRVQFSPFDGMYVSPLDGYWSDWAGSHLRNGRSLRLDGGTTPVVGLRGTSGMVLNSLSLLLAHL